MLYTKQKPYLLFGSFPANPSLISRRFKTWPQGKPHRPIANHQLSNKPALTAQVPSPTSLEVTAQHQKALITSFQPRDFS